MAGRKPVPYIVIMRSRPAIASALDYSANMDCTVIDFYQALLDGEEASETSLRRRVHPNAEGYAFCRSGTEGAGGKGLIPHFYREISYCIHSKSSAFRVREAEDFVSQ